MDFTLKTKQLVRADLDDFVACFHAENRYERAATWSTSCCVRPSSCYIIAMTTATALALANIALAK